LVTLVSFFSQAASNAAIIAKKTYFFMSRLSLFRSGAAVYVCGVSNGLREFLRTRESSATRVGY
jgi:hypothetical protein